MLRVRIQLVFIFSQLGFFTGSFVFLKAAAHKDAHF